MIQWCVFVLVVLNFHAFLFYVRELSLKLCVSQKFWALCDIVTQTAQSVKGSLQAECLGLHSKQGQSFFFISTTASGLALGFFKPFNPVRTGVSFLGDKIARV